MTLVAWSVNWLEGNALETIDAMMARFGAPHPDETDGLALLQFLRRGNFLTISGVFGFRERASAWEKQPIPHGTDSAIWNKPRRRGCYAGR
jgi:hypothetical protein